MTEFDFIRRYLQRQQPDRDVVLGIGDDAANLACFFATVVFFIPVVAFSFDICIAIGE